MADSKEKMYYYILFDNYTQGMALQGYLREAKIPSRISPAPRCIQGELGCGMSILFQPEDLERVEACIAQHQAEYHDIVLLENQINPRRNRFC